MSSLPQSGPRQRRCTDIWRRLPILIPLPELIERSRIDISGVVHAGAHTGEEAESYEACGVSRVLWIEANPELMAALNEHVYPYGHVTVCACLGARCFPS